MSFHHIAAFFLIMGCATLIIGVADIAVTVALRHTHRVRNIIIGGAFVLLGILIVWLSQQRTATFHIDLGPVLNNLGGGFLVLVIGLCAFALRAVMSIREAQARLQATNPSRFTIWRSRYEVISGILFIALIIFGLLLFLSHGAR